MLLSEHKKGNMFKAKTLIEKVGTRYLITSADNSWSPPVPFHTALKIPQPNIFTLSYTYPCVREGEWVSVSVCVCVCVCVCLPMWDCVCFSTCVSLWWWAMLIKREYVRLRNGWMCVCVYVCIYVCECVCWSMWVCVFVMISHVDKAWICSAEEFLEQYGKLEAVVTNCLLRWSGHLFEVTSTYLFGQSFCFTVNILAFSLLG